MEREEIFRSRLKSLRAERKLSQQKVADGIGITKVGYQNYESGRKSPSFTSLSRLAEFFNVSTDYLVGLSDEPQLPDKETWVLIKSLKAYRQIQ